MDAGMGCSGEAGGPQAGWEGCAPLLAGGLVALGLGIRLAIAWQPLDVLVPKVLSDDAFYYFKIAEHMAHGLGPTFDGERLTNGFHPLWALLLGGLCVVQGEGRVPIPWALSVAALLDVATGALIYLVARRALRGAGPALLSAVVYLLHPMAILEGVNGLETALATLAFAGLFAYYLLVLRPRPTWAAYAGFGLLSACMVLARTDSIFLTLVLGLERLWAGRGRHLPKLALAGAVFLLAIAPWLAWSQVAVGSPVQTSGLAVPYVIRTYLFGLSGLTGLLRFLGPVVYLSSVLAQGLVRYSGAQGLVLVLLLLLWAAGSRSGAGERKGSAADLALLLPLLASALHLAFHAYGRWFLRGWYYAPWMVGLAWAVGWAASRAGRAAPPGLRQWMWGGLAAAFLAVALGQGAGIWKQGLWPWQESVVRASLWARDHLPPGARLGAFNAGIPGYFAGFAVVNLDGVVNGEAFAAVRERRVLAYLEEAGITHLLDWRSTVEGDYRPFFEDGYLAHLRPLQTFPDPHHGEVVVYQVEP
ncbi:MAG: ArnT family glycosyltransferase [Anaerolineae bacterium]